MATTMTFTSLLQDLRNYIERGYTAASDPTVFDQLPRLVNLAERACATELKVEGFIEPVAFNMQRGLAVYDKPDRWREWVSVSVGTAPTIGTAVRNAVGTARILTLQKPHGYQVGQSVTISGVGVTGYDGTYVLVAVTQLTLQYNTGVNLFESATPDTGGLVSLITNQRHFLFPRSYEYLRSYATDPDQLSLPLYYADYDYYHLIVGPSPDRAYPCELILYQLPALLDSGNQTNWLTDIAPNLLLYRSLLEAAPFLKNDERLQTWQGLYAQAAQALTGQDMDKINDRTSERGKP